MLKLIVIPLTAIALFSTVVVAGSAQYYTTMIGTGYKIVGLKLDYEDVTNPKICADKCFESGCALLTYLPYCTISAEKKSLVKDSNSTELIFEMIGDKPSRNVDFKFYEKALLSCAPPQKPTIVLEDYMAVSFWAKWSQCSKSCGGGHRIRSRFVTEELKGEFSSNATEVCETQPCVFPSDACNEDFTFGVRDGIEVCVENK